MVLVPVPVPVPCPKGPWSDCWMYPSVGTFRHCMRIRMFAYRCSLPLPHTIHPRAGVQRGCPISCTSCLEVCTEGVNLARKTQGRASCSTPSFPPPHQKLFLGLASRRRKRGRLFPADTSAPGPSAIGCPWPRAAVKCQAAVPGGQHEHLTLLHFSCRMKAVLLILLLWAAARAHPVPGHLSASQEPEDAAPGDVANALGPVLGDEDHGRLRANLGPWETSDADVAIGNHVERDLAEHNGLPDWPGDEEDDSGDDTFDEDKEEGAGPAYGTGDIGGHGDSSSSSSSESAMAPRRHIRYRGGSRWGGGSSSSQEDDEESIGLGSEGMQGDDPSVFDSLGGRNRGSPWEDEDSHSPETEDTNSIEDSEEKSHSQENSEASKSSEDSGSREDGDSPSQEDGDSPSREDEDSPSQEDGDSPSQENGDSPSQEASDEESAEDGSEEAVSASQERSSREERASAEDRSAVSNLDTEEEQSRSKEDSLETEEDISKPDEDAPSESTESQSSSPEGSQEDSDGEEDRAVSEESTSTESTNSASPEEDDDDDDEHSQEATSRGDASSLSSLTHRRRRPGAYHRKQAAELDDNDCQDGY
ncbi:dentin matrix acidic phosphoprotein 1 [Coturnix japonica]|uniref:Dentin matrix acidic phosphoprotein 1 n=1 Tax=Coturnix japonica TaxID=93934 RepID=A0A8C2YAB0_COTJA|nr:dentin matrix acidic phosphoprotein 1 [Coturnix japonica]